MKNIISYIVDYFSRPLTVMYQASVWIVISAIYIFIIFTMLNLGGCSSFEHTIKYKPNTFWRETK